MAGRPSDHRGGKDLVITRMLYKRQGDTALYCQLWGERDKVHLTYGTVGDEKSRTEAAVSGCRDLAGAVEAEVARLKAAGYREPTLESYYRVQAAVPTAGLDREAARERQDAVCDTLTEYLGWTGNGLGEIERTKLVPGSACVTALVYDPVLAAQTLPDWMAGQEIPEDVVVTIEDHSGGRKIVWPRGGGAG